MFNKPKSLIRFFTYQPINISRKAGMKCCPYGQNGKPLSEDKVKNFLFTVNVNKDFWKANSDFTKLTCTFLFKNVFKMLDFVKEVYQYDKNADIQQVPNIRIFKQEFLEIELYTHQLKGLSNKDLQLAAIISTLNTDKYSMTLLNSTSEDMKELRYEVRKIDIENPNKEKERTKIKNRYDDLI